LISLETHRGLTVKVIVVRRPPGKIPQLGMLSGKRLVGASRGGRLGKHSISSVWPIIILLGLTPKLFLKASQPIIVYIVSKILSHSTATILEAGRPVDLLCGGDDDDLSG
jgi:hypothetical protein